MPTKFREAISPQALKKRECEIVILEEGPGNKSKNCWYGPEAITSGKEVFRGVQVYSDHPTKMQQSDLPERSIRDIVGRIKETYIHKDPSSGKVQLRGVLKVLEGDQYDWVLSLMQESMTALREGYPPVAQVSIHADGDIDKRKIGNQDYNYVKNIKSAVSVDIVTKGGIRSAGFTKFVESFLGGKSMTRTEERLAQIQQKMAESLNGEDQSFLESLQESEEDGDFEEVYVGEDGNIYTEDGEQVDPEECAAVDDEGYEVPEEALMAMGEEMGEEIGEPEEGEAEYAEDYDDYSEEIEEPEYDEPMVYADGGDDEVPISELATRYPYIADEIDSEEYGMEESDRDPELVNLKFENKLLKSRLIAERKIMESQLPAGFISIDELIGKEPEDMNRLLESRAAMFENIATMVESQAPVVVDAGASRDATDPGVGRRILSSSVLAF